MLLRRIKHVENVVKICGGGVFGIYHIILMTSRKHEEKAYSNNDEPSYTLFYHKIFPKSDILIEKPDAISSNARNGLPYIEDK